MKLTRPLFMRGVSFPSDAIRARCIVLVVPMLFTSVHAVETLNKIAATGRITLGYDSSSQPFSYLGENGQPIGYSIDICMKVAEAVKKELKRPDLAIRFVMIPSSSSLMAVVTGDVDMECGSTTSTAYRRKQVSFTIPTFFTRTTFMTREGGGFSIPHGLAGRTVVATKGSHGEEQFDEMRARLDAKLVLGKDDRESMALLDDGAADAFISDDVRLRRLQALAKDPARYQIAQFALSVEPLSVVLSKDDKSFKKLVDAEIARLFTQGELRTIYRKWFQSPIPPQAINLNMPMGSLLRESMQTPTDWVPR